MKESDELKAVTVDLLMAARPPILGSGSGLKTSPWDGLDELYPGEELLYFPFFSGRLCIQYSFFAAQLCEPRQHGIHMQQLYRREHRWILEFHLLSPTPLPTLRLSCLRVVARSFSSIYTNISEGEHLLISISC